MRLEDAPRPGWYPDPEGGGRLRWWEGVDWTDERRAPPSSSEVREADATGPDDSPRERPTVPAAATRGLSDSEQIVSQVREAAREEASRAAELFAQRARATIDQGRSVVADYVGVVLRWVKIAIVVAAVLVIAWFVLQFVAQVTFFEWIGDRIDNITDG